MTSNQQYVEKVLAQEVTSEHVASLGYALAEIADLLDGTEWNPDTLNAVAAICRAAGFTVREPHQIET